MVASEKLAFATLKFRGLTSRQRQVQLRRLFHSRRLDIVAVQKTKIENEEDAERALQPFSSECNVLVKHAVGFSAGCFLFLRKTLPCSGLTYNIDTEGRLICCDFLLYKKPCRLINVYAYNNAAQRINLLEGVVSLLDCDRYTVLMGDFNCVCDPSDRAGADARIDRTGAVLSRTIEDAVLIDT